MSGELALEHWRLFLAVFPDAGAVTSITEAIRALPSTRETEALRWLSDSQLHITLRFLGSVPAERVASISSACAVAVASCMGFELEVCGAGAFASARRASVLWLGSGVGTAALRALATRVNAAIDAQGFTPEAREFQAHLTLARSKRPRSLLQTIESLRGLRVQFRVDEVVLVRSHTGPKGSRYEVLERFALGS